MLKRIVTHDVEPADLSVDLAPRLNVLTGDNGLGKTFLLDVAWWVSTDTWSRSPAIPKRGKDVAPEIRWDELLLLIDEVDAHLHPTWQRVMVPALFEVIPAIAPVLRTQVIVSTHAPLVLASVETMFDPERDALVHFALEGSAIQAHTIPWTKQGDVVNWLVSDAFGLHRSDLRRVAPLLARAVEKGRLSQSETSEER